MLQRRTGYGNDAIVAQIKHLQWSKAGKGMILQHIDLIVTQR